MPEDIDYNSVAKKEWKKAARNVFRKNQQMMGTRTSMLIAIDQAKRFMKYDQYYFVWYLDWRGRMYPRGGALVPQGSEVCKAMLEFAEGQPLGQRGFYWLTVHLANCLGYDKLPYDQRIKEVLKRGEEIKQWDKDPLEHKSWSDTDSPYMALAAAFEWCAACRLRDPTTFVSRLPINMDGTTNGLQHLSALGRDLVGATATNLVPTGKPNDIYAQVASECDKKIEEDYKEWLDAGAPTVACVREESCPVTIARLRKLVGSANWRGRITRKTCKRGTMTTPYSVTRQGVREQAINDGFLQFAVDDPEMDVNIAADYLRDCLWNSIGNIIVNSRSIMTWLQACARVVMDEEGEKNICWRTPEGMLVNQDYLRPRVRQIETSDRIYTIYVKDEERKLMKRKQINAIAPNFIHSLDASHLCRVIRRLWDSGVRSMCMIHDSYGVHACHVDLMHKTIRESFVEIHNEPLLENFKEGLEAYVDGILPPIPDKGEYDLEDMLKADYAFC
jgi:DNA-directed RNA polymerase